MKKYRQGAIDFSRLIAYKHLQEGKTFGLEKVLARKLKIAYSTFTVIKKSKLNWSVAQIEVILNFFDIDFKHLRTFLAH